MIIVVRATDGDHVVPVSVQVARVTSQQALAGTRDDVIQPDTSPAGAIRDADGRIVAVRGYQI